jgi:cytochrome c-type biogenesis protein CcmH
MVITSRIHLCLRAVTVAAMLAMTSAPPVFAVQPDEVLSDAALEKRARNLSADLRCLVCQNQSIDDSDAPLAKDLRVLVRERLVAGDSDEKVMDYIVQRYGDFVLLKPPVNSHTLLLWLAPLLGLAAAIAVIFRALRRQVPANVATPAPLTPSEEQEIERLLQSARQSGKKSG